MCERLVDPQKHSFDAGVTREGKWLWSARGVWLGMIAFAVSLVGTELLRLEFSRVLAAMLRVGAGVLGVLALGDSQWLPVFQANGDNDSVNWMVPVGRRRSSL